jgi:hypothetical protein
MLTLAATGDFAQASWRDQIDKLFGVLATTRNWNTILAVLRLLKDGEKKATDRLGAGAND